MIHEFEGKSEKEAIDNAIESLGLNREEIDVEILESKKKPFFFGAGKVKIRVHLTEGQDEPLEPESDVERKIQEFLSQLVARMGFDAEVELIAREEGKLKFEISSDHSAIVIGRQGKTLDAFQLLCNIYAGRINEHKIKVIVDAENYRERREAQLVRMANKVADQVRRSKSSRLLDAMNPFERRLIHTALNDRKNIETISEGDGLYKKIRVLYKE
jgi:spoIIIJ-associated protein